MEPLPPIDYAGKGTKFPPVRPYGLFSLMLCFVQFPWLVCGGWAFWAILFGDNQPPMGGFVLSFIGMGLPCIMAIGLGVVAMGRSHGFRADRIAGLLGCVGGIGWGAFIFRKFLELMQTRV